MQPRAKSQKNTPGRVAGDLTPHVSSDGNGSQYTSGWGLTCIKRPKSRSKGCRPSPRRERGLQLLQGGLVVGQVLPNAHRWHPSALDPLAMLAKRNHPCKRPHTTCAPIQTHLTVLPHWGVPEERLDARLLPQEPQVVCLVFCHAW